MRNLLALLTGVAVVAACGNDAGIVASASAVPAAPVAQDADPTGKQTAVIMNADAEGIGEATLTPGPNGLVINLSASDIPEGYHGVHLHQVGKCTDPEDGFKRSGSHINIAGNKHGILNPEGYHIGADFPNIYSDGEELESELFAAGLMYDQAMDDDGFAVIIHENEDDYKTQPIGGAGARIACASFN